jgi:hypothetical protein
MQGLSGFDEICIRRLVRERRRVVEVEQNAGERRG